jgi:hypothetical protein
MWFFMFKKLILFCVSSVMIPFILISSNEPEEGNIDRYIPLGPPEGIFYAPDLEVVKPYVTENTWVLLNIAEVLTDSQMDLGTSRWRKFIKKASENWEGNSDYNVHDILSFLVFKKIPHKSVESNTPSIVSQWQEQEIVVMALTSRGRSQWYDTYIKKVDKLTNDVLKGIGFDFSKTILPDEFSGIKKSFRANYFKGIFYADNVEKGDLIKDVLIETGYHPAKIVYMDDKMDSIEEMQAACETLGIPFAGFWNNSTVPKHRDFNPMIANIQLESLLFYDEILTNEQAAEFLNSKLFPYHNMDPEQFFLELLDRIDFSEIKL